VSFASNSGLSDPSVPDSRVADHGGLPHLPSNLPAAQG